MAAVSSDGSQRLPGLEMLGPLLQPSISTISSLTARMIWPVTCEALSDASHATTGDDSDGSIGFHSSNSSGSLASMPAPGMDAAMRVAPAGPMALTVTPILNTSRLTVMVKAAMPALAAV